MSSFSEQASFILSETNDGDQLDSSHLYLIQLAANGDLSKAGKEAFLKLYESVKNGKYQKPWFRGITNMTKDQNGAVFWKDQQIEHFDFDYWQGENWQKDELTAAKNLERICLKLESQGIEPNLSTVFDVD